MSEAPIYPMAGAIALMARPYDVKRRGMGSFTSGEYVAATPATVPISAVVWPASGRELQKLPEGQRSAGTVALVTSTQLHGKDVTNMPDVLVYEGEEYELKLCAPWLQGGFWYALAAKVGAQ